MSEEEILYLALASQFGLVVRASKSSLQRAKAKLEKSDSALLELALLGPDASGQTFILRTDQASKQAER